MMSEGLLFYRANNILSIKIYFLSSLEATSGGFLFDFGTQRTIFGTHRTICHKK